MRASAGVQDAEAVGHGVVAVVLARQALTELPLGAVLGMEAPGKPWMMATVGLLVILIWLQCFLASAVADFGVEPLFVELVAGFAFKLFGRIF